MTAPGSIWPPGWTVRHVAETGSTNADLLAALDDGIGQPPARAARRPPDRRPWPSRSDLGGATRGEPAGVARVHPRARGGGHPHAADRAGGRRRRARLHAGRPTDASDGRAQVAERRPARRSQAGRDPGAAVGVERARSSSAWGSTSAGRPRVRPGSARAWRRRTACSAPCSRASTRCRPTAPIGIGPNSTPSAGDVRVELPGDAVLVGRATGVDAIGRLVVEDPDGGEHHLDVGDVIHATAAGIARTHPDRSGRRRETDVSWGAATVRTARQ